MKPYPILIQHLHAFIRSAQKAGQKLYHYLVTPESKAVKSSSDLSNHLTQGRNRILTVMLRTGSLSGMLVILYLAGDLLARGRWEIAAVYMIIMITIGVISYLPRISYTVRAVTFLTILFLVGTIDLSLFGIAEDWRLFYSGFSILAAVFLGWRTGLAALFLSLTTFIVLAWQIAQKNIVVTASTLGSPIPTVENIVAISLAYTIINAVIIYAVANLLNEFENATQKEHKAAVSLEQKTVELANSLNREQKLSRKLTTTLQQEEEISQLRSTIITTVSHEFRTPLTVINNSANLLNKYYSQLSADKRQEQFERIRNSIFYLNQLLQDISIVERTKKADIHFQPMPVSIGNLFAKLSSDLLQETDNPANVQFQFSGDKNQTIVVDYNLLKRIVSNLLLNALKFSTPTSPITIHLATDTQLTITVSDQGIGIPKDDKHKIGGLFQRGSNIETRNGLGLGLFIVQQLTQIMSGTITMTDNPTGQGTIFTIQLPISPID